MGSIFLTEDAQTPTYAREGGVGRDIDGCIISVACVATDIGVNPEVNPVAIAGCMRTDFCQNVYCGWRCMGASASNPCGTSI